MARRVVWSPRALADVEAIASYIAADSPFYASTVVRRIIALTRSLADFPLAGRRVPEFDEQDIRELLVYSYRIHLPGGRKSSHHRLRNPRQADALEPALVQPPEATHVGTAALG